jgi:hypothetical protein
MAGGGGGKKGGGGAGAVDVDVQSSSTSIVDADTNAVITSTSNTDLTSTSTNQIDSRANAQLQIVGLDDIKIKADADMASDSKTQLDLDVKPLQADFCFKIGLERLPSTKVCKPVSRHFAFTLFGVEIVGFNYVAEEKTIIEDLANRPFIALGQPQAAKSSPHWTHESDGVSLRLSE